ncbi:MAG: alpha/beta fold hydrolase [Hyphomicrobiales bacterium]|nr:MAG: alpha/beta fold hydrolase [Hyphomicrobiales bacterium]
MHTMTSADGSITAVRAGQGRDLFIVHSLLADRTAFDAVVPALAARYRVTLVNLPGFHGSRPVAAGIENYAAFIGRAFAAFEIGNDAILAGNGFGGTVALAYAQTAPTAIGKLLLCDVAAAFPEEGKQAFRVMAEKVTAGGLGEIATIAANRVYHAAYVAQNPGAIEERKRVLLAIDPGAFVAACQSLVSCDLVPRLANVTAPTFVMYGALDQATPPPLNKIIAAGIPGAALIELPDCGHCPPLERPQEFLKAVGPFLGLA